MIVLMTMTASRTTIAQEFALLAGASSINLLLYKRNHYQVNSLSNSPLVATNRTNFARNFHHGDCLIELGYADSTTEL